MASASGSSKSKRSKKTEASELSDDNSSDGSEMSLEALTPGKRLKTDESVKDDQEEDKTKENNQKPEASTYKCEAGKDNKIRIKKSIKKGEASSSNCESGIDKDVKNVKGDREENKTSGSNQKHEASSYRSEVGKDNKIKIKKTVLKGEASCSNNESGMNICDKTKKTKQKAEASTSKGESDAGKSKKNKKGKGGASTSKNEGGTASQSGSAQASSSLSIQQQIEKLQKAVREHTGEDSSSSSSSSSDESSSGEEGNPFANSLYFSANPARQAPGSTLAEDVREILDAAETLNSEREEESDAEPAPEPITDEIIQKYDPTPKSARPKHNWSTMDHFMGRQYGSSIKYPVDASRENCCGSLHVVERLELMYKMKKHDGCVNTLNFNASGTKLVSGSDDLSVIIWDWTQGEHSLEYRSGHNTNVFQAKFMPLCDDKKIVTCARDGQVRLGQVQPDGSFRTRKLAQHKGSVHKLAIHTDSPDCVLTCGEDTAVFAIDIREDKPSKILSCKHANKKVPLYSIFSNPQKSHEFVVAGRCPFVKIYDRRFLTESENFVYQFCPEHLENDNKFNVTCAVYNYNGEEILSSYNDEDIYLFNSKETTSSKYLHRYRGHRNSQTVKGVNYFGSKSEFIVSGSDCGNIFFWDKESEHIVKYMYGDEGGAVNCLEPHPNIPVLATSGLDDDIKIWVPSCDFAPDMSNLQKHIIRNMKCREEDTREYPDAFVDQTIWFLMQHLSRARRRDEEGTSNSDSSSTLSDDEYDVDISPSRCNQS